MMTTTSTDDDEYRSMKSSPFFHVAPRKRKRNVSSSSCGYRGDYQMAHQHALPPIEPYKTSLYVLSRFLTNHMAQTQTQTNGFTKEEPRTLIQEEDSVRVDSIPCILSGQHLFLEDTLSFSPLPRYATNTLRWSRLWNALCCLSLYLIFFIYTVDPTTVVYAFLTEHLILCFQNPPRSRPPSSSRSRQCGVRSWTWKGKGVSMRGS